MGLTHYLYVKDTAPLVKLDEAVLDCVKLVEATEVPLAGPMGDEGTKPRICIHPAYIAFNGVGEDSHETFLFPPSLGEDAYRPERDPSWVFSFCKTARKPYDAVVVACLLRIEHILGADVKIETDTSTLDEFMGDELTEGWAHVNAMLGHPTENVHKETAAQLYARVFNEPPPIPSCFPVGTRGVTSDA